MPLLRYIAVIAAFRYRLIDMIHAVIYVISH